MCFLDCVGTKGVSSLAQCQRKKIYIWSGAWSASDVLGLSVSGWDYKLTAARERILRSDRIVGLDK